MREALIKISENASLKKVLVVGDLMLDRYLFGSAERISPESPVPVVHFDNEEKRIGGAGNVAMNILGLGLNCDIISLVGDDIAAEEIINVLKENKCNVSGLIKIPSRSTTEKIRILANRQQVVRLDREDIQELQQHESKLLQQKLADKINDVDVVILSDYGKGVLSHEMCQWAIDRCIKSKVPILVDPKGTDWSKYKGADLITPNLKEAKEVTSFTILTDSDVEKACNELSKKYSIKSVLVTQGENGMTLYQEGFIRKIDAKRTEVFDVSGAGDTVISTVACMLAIGLTLDESAFIANQAAGIVVSKMGTHPIQFDELKRSLSFDWNSSPNRKIFEFKMLREMVDLWRRNGEKIVFTNGCFDILHVGHVSLFHQAKSKGDRLIVGLNSDASIKELKGENRPINNETDRSKILTYLETIDGICIFNELTPLILIEAIVPDVLVKGGDYNDADIVGAEFVKQNGGKVEIIPFVEGFSTTKVIESIAGTINVTYNQND